MMIRFKRHFLLTCTFLILLTCGQVSGQEPPLKSIHYRLGMTRPTSHLFEVLIEVELPPERINKPLQFQMAKWSPGRYAVFDFAKNVQEFSANGPVTRVDDQTWSVAPRGAA